MNSNYGEYAVELLKSWFDFNKDFFVGYGGIAEYKDSGRGSAHVVIETSCHFVDVSAWNHASCLDIEIINIQSEESVFPHVGSCESREAFENHLKNVIFWLRGEKECT